MRNQLSPAQGEQRIPRRMKPGFGMTRFFRKWTTKGLNHNTLPFSSLLEAIAGIDAEADDRGDF
jgi:hypothetical protein